MEDVFMGMWHWDPDVPEAQWCDCDYVADFIVESGYTPNTSIEEVVYNIIACYDQYLTLRNLKFYCIEEDTRDFPMNKMIHMTDVSWFVRDNGGIKEFDYRLES